MKIGIFSYIHGNIYAFEKIWSNLMAESCDLYLFLGDICGYYYYQNEIIDKFRQASNLICIRGNHDKLFLDMINDNKIEKEYTIRYGKSLKLLKENIRKENFNFLKKLPDYRVLDEYGIVMYHGSPWNHLDGYVYPTDPIDKFQYLEFKFVLLGHTHYFMDRFIGGTRIINPGSSGQPRDGGYPSYALLDLKKRTIGVKRIRYDCHPMIKDVSKNSDDNPYLISVLKRRKGDR